MPTPKQFKEYFETDFTPSQGLDEQKRIANALEYIAFHAGQINRQLTTLSDRVGMIEENMRE